MNKMTRWGLWEFGEGSGVVGEAVAVGGECRESLNGLFVVEANKDADIG